MRRIKLFLVFILLALIVFVGNVDTANAGGFFEVGTVTLTTTTDNGGWVTVNMTQTYVNPIVVAGALTHNNVNSLSVRVRNVNAGAGTFEIGMQAPCESFPPAAVACPFGGAWFAGGETAYYLVMEEGTWVFPDGLELEAYLHNTNTVRYSGGDFADTINLSHTYPADPAVLHTVNSATDVSWITTTVFESAGGLLTVAAPPTGPDFALALEGAEATTNHGFEDIGWIAIQPGIGTNATYAYEVGRTAGLPVDRHDDGIGCWGIGGFTSFAAPPDVISNQHTMSGTNGAWLRLCGAEVETNQVNVHVEEDQVNDSERAGNTEDAAWFAYEAGMFGALDFITADVAVVDDDGGVLLAGDTLTYTIVLTNQEDDFAQVNNVTPEFTVPIPANTTFVVGSPTVTGGIFANNAGTMEWDGPIAANGTVTLTYQVQVNAGVSCLDITSQGTVHMDPNGDLFNSIDELSDDPAADDGADVDGDNLTDDDDTTDISVACDADLAITKTDTPDPVAPGGVLTYQLDVTNNGPGDADNTTVVDVLPAGVTLLLAVPSQGGPCIGTTTVTCNLGTVNNGATASVSITVMATTATGTVTNTGSVSADNVDPNLADNDVTEGTTISVGGGTGVVPGGGDGGGTGSCVICAGESTVFTDLEYIDKSVDLTLANISDTLTYTINFTNPKSITLHQVVIQDTLDSRLENIQIVSYSPDYDYALVQVDGHTVNMQGFDLAPGAGGELVIQAVISDAARSGDRITNQAVLASPDASMHTSPVIVTYVNPVDFGAAQSRLVLTYVNPVALHGPSDAAESFIIPEQLPITGETPDGVQWVQRLAPLLAAMVVLGMVGIITWRRKTVASTSR